MAKEDEIRARAYVLWEQQGRPDGLHEAHWEQARREIAKGDANEPEPGLPEQFEAKDGDHGIPPRGSHER
jgi:hypothetical protein